MAGKKMNEAGYKRYLHIAIIIAAAIFVYSNTFQVPFHLDDDINISINPLVQNSQFLFNPSLYCSKVSPMTEEENACRFFRTRYFGYLTFALNYELGGIDVVGYHVLNLAIHIVCALLVYLLVILTFRTPYLVRSELKESAQAIALFSGLIFAVHPVQTQAVTYIVQRFASLATMLYLLSLVSYVKWRLIRNDRDEENQEGGHKSVPAKALVVLLYLASVTAAVLAMKTKEIAFTLPLIVMLYEFIFFRGKVSRRLVPLIPYILTLLIVPLSLIGLSGPSGQLVDSLSKSTNLYSSLSRWEYLFTEFRVIPTYLRLLVLPVNQNLDYDYPEYHSFFNPGVLLSFLFLSLIFGTVLYLLVRFRNRQSHVRLVAFGVFWFFITLSVESSVIPIVDVIFEHRLYLPSAGIFISATTALFWLVGRYKNRWKRVEDITIVFLAAIIIALGIAAYARNNVWRDHISLWGDVVSKSPNKVRATYNLAHAYQERKYFEKAIELYEKVIALDQKNIRAYYNLANIYRENKQFDKAIEMYGKVLSLDLKYFEAYNNLGNIFIDLGQYDKAIEYLTAAIVINPGSERIYHNRGRAYLKSRQYDKAIDDFTKAVLVNRYHAKSYFLRGVAYNSQGKRMEALVNFQISCKLGNSEGCGAAAQSFKNAVVR